MITTKCISHKIQQTIAILLPQNAWYNIYFQISIEFHKQFQCNDWLCNSMTNLEIAGCVFDSSNVWAYDSRLSFDFMPSFWCELELKNRSRR